MAPPLPQLESITKKRKMRPSRRLFLSLFASLGLFLVLGQSPGKAFLSAAEQTLSFKAPILIKEGQTLGQTFLSWHRGLKGINVLLRPLEKGSGQIGFHLRENSQSKNDLIYLNLPVSRIKEAGYTLFSFDPLKDSASHDYYFFLTIQGTGTLEAATGPGDSYLQGALYQNGVAQEKQLNFHLQHQTGQRLLGLGLEGLRWLGLLLLSAWLYHCSRLGAATSSGNFLWAAFLGGKNRPGGRFDPGPVSPPVSLDRSDRFSLGSLLCLDPIPPGNIRHSLAKPFPAARRPQKGMVFLGPIREMLA